MQPSAIPRPVYTSLCDNIKGYVSLLEIKGYDALLELALNIRCSWNHSFDKVWQQLEPDLWNLTRNPWVVLQTASRERLENTLSDPDFCKVVDELVQATRLEETSDTWFQQAYPKSTLSCVAYFSMEFMLCEALPIYSGGLGNVAGDQLKAAGDLGVPVVGVGLLYQQGYFRQVIDKDGRQQAFFPFNDPGQLPLTPVRQKNGEWLRVKLSFPGFSFWLRTWQVQVGRRTLYLLDSNDPENFPPHRSITSELYGGGSELRLKQELVLGIGGWRLLRLLGIKPEVCHLNEGHSAFLVLERALNFMKETGQSFEVALAATRVGNLFTTHTAVPAGFDQFSPWLIEHYLGAYARDKLGLSLNDLLALGRKNPNDTQELFNMAYLAIHGSGAVNGVSVLHGKVSRKIFASLFQRWPEEEVPVSSVTNGVHTPSWDSQAADELWTTHCGKNRWRKTAEALEVAIRAVPDVELWQMRNKSRKTLVEYTRERLARQLSVIWESAEEIERAKSIFDPNTLTLGFARRFATYKRPNMLLMDSERLLRILTNAQRPVQLIIAGKAHPADQQGQELIAQWSQFIKRTEARAHVVFLSDDDMLLTEQLVAGVDVWINTPRRPWEACGTSGMKVLVNGGLNLSELDGWWAEAYRPELGWALGDMEEHGDDPSWDAFEAEKLYDLLEHEVVPQFYMRNADGIPTVWVAKMRESIATLTARFSSYRAVREYTEKHYLPAATNFLVRTKDNGKVAQQLVDWKHKIQKHWNDLRFGQIKIETQDNMHFFDVQVYLDELDPAAVKLELYAGAYNGNEPVLQEMTRTKQLIGTSGLYEYQAKVPANLDSSEYTPRVVPYFEGAKVPLEASQILWQK